MLWFIDFGRGSALPQTPEDSPHSGEQVVVDGAHASTNKKPGAPRYKWNCCTCKALSPCSDRSHVDVLPSPSVYGSPISEMDQDVCRKKQPQQSTAVCQQPSVSNPEQHPIQRVQESTRPQRRVFTRHGSYSCRIVVHNDDKILMRDVVLPNSNKFKNTGHNLSMRKPEGIGKSKSFRKVFKTSQSWSFPDQITAEGANKKLPSDERTGLQDTKSFNNDVSTSRMSTKSKRESLYKRQVSIKHKPVKTNSDPTSNVHLAIGSDGTKRKHVGVSFKLTGSALSGNDIASANIATVADVDSEEIVAVVTIGESVTPSHDWISSDVVEATAEVSSSELGSTSNSELVTATDDVMTTSYDLTSNEPLGISSDGSLTSNPCVTTANDLKVSGIDTTTNSANGSENISLNNELNESEVLTITKLVNARTTEEANGSTIVSLTNYSNSSDFVAIINTYQNGSDTSSKPSEISNDISESKLPTPSSDLTRYIQHSPSGDLTAAEILGCERVAARCDSLSSEYTTARTDSICSDYITARNDSTASSDLITLSNDSTSGEFVTSSDCVSIELVPAAYHRENTGDLVTVSLTRHGLAVLSNNLRLSDIVGSAPQSVMTGFVRAEGPVDLSLPQRSEVATASGSDNRPPATNEHQVFHNQVDENIYGETKCFPF